MDNQMLSFFKRNFPHFREALVAISPGVIGNIKYYMNEKKDEQYLKNEFNRVLRPITIGHGVNFSNNRSLPSVVSRHVDLTKAWNTDGTFFFYYELFDKSSKKLRENLDEPRLFLSTRNKYFPFGSINSDKIDTHFLRNSVMMNWVIENRDLPNKPVFRRIWDNLYGASSGEYFFDRYMERYNIKKDFKEWFKPDRMFSGSGFPFKPLF